MIIATLAEYEIEIAKAIAAKDLQRLADISVSIRRALWNNRKAAADLAASADAEARKLEEFYTPLPRWLASYSPCSGHAPAIQ